jgi:hypothetical protein
MTKLALIIAVLASLVGASMASASVSHRCQRFANVYNVVAGQGATCTEARAVARAFDKVPGEYGIIRSGPYYWQCGEPTDPLCRMPGLKLPNHYSWECGRRIIQLGSVARATCYGFSQGAAKVWAPMVRWDEGYGE